VNRGNDKMHFTLYTHESLTILSGLPRGVMTGNQELAEAVRACEQKFFKAFEQSPIAVEGSRQADRLGFCPGISLFELWCR
jgi:hypothetical protein